MYLHYLVLVNVSLVRKVCCRCKQMNEAARHPFLVNIFCYNLAHKVLPGPGPAVERQNQRFLWVHVVHEACDGFQDDLRRDMLPVQLCVEVILQTCE